MDPSKLEAVNKTTFVSLLRQHGLYRDDDVTFEDLDEGGTFVYRGDDFRIDADALEALEVVGLLIIGSLHTGRLAIHQVVPEIGVLGVTGDVRCTDLYYRTECTGVSIGGDLVVDKIVYAECGNSVLQVNGDLVAKVLYVAQCSVDVRGEARTEHDDEVTVADLAGLGLDTAGHDEPDEVLEAYLDALT